MSDITKQLIPPSKLGQIKRFARDMAWKILNNEMDFIYYSRSTQQLINRHDAPNPFAYVKSVWEDRPIPSLQVMRAMGYFEFNREIPWDRDTIDCYHVTEKAILLLDDVVPATTFISYKREESSALALLVLARLKEYGLSAYLDVNELSVGDKWHAQLESKIATLDNFIVLIGPTTLKSPNVRQEIKWAQIYDKNIYPVWHNGYNGSEEGIPETEIESMKIVTKTTNAAEVKVENPSDYTAALFALLSNYGITI